MQPLPVESQHPWYQYQAGISELMAAITACLGSGMSLPEKLRLGRGLEQSEMAVGWVVNAGQHSVHELPFVAFPDQSRRDFRDPNHFC